MGALSATPVLIKDFGSNLARPGRRFVACNFISRVLIAHPDISPVSWDAMSSSVQAVPGLPVGETYRGVNSFQGFVFVWSGFRLKWCDQNDMTTWIPVATTTSTFAFKLTQAFTLGAVNVESDYLYVDQNPTGLTAGQFVRIDTDPLYTFFSVGKVLPTAGASGTASGFSQTIAAGATKDLFLQSYTPFVQGERVYFAGTPSAFLEVQSNATQAAQVGLVLAADFTAPAVGSAVTASLTSTPILLSPGMYVSVGRAAQPGFDVYQVSSMDVNANTAVLKRMGVYSTTAAIHFAGEFVVAQPYVTVKNISATNATSSFAEPVNEAYGFTVTPQNLTGAQAVGYVYPIGTEMLTVDANGAGEDVNVGAEVNGPILHFETLSDMGYILKNRSIQSVQYTPGTGTSFFIRPEVKDEGLVGAYAFVKVGNDKLFFWGNKGIYQYLGGNALQPIAIQHYKQLKEELDLSRADQIVGYHNENDFEVWFIYPRRDKGSAYGSLRVFIFNYLEGSVTIDDYPTTYGSFSAAARVNWNTDLAWTAAQGTWAAPTSFSASDIWPDLASDADQAFTVLGQQKNAPPVVPAMTMADAYAMYYASHPVTPPVPEPGDALKFLVALNTYWKNNGNWPALGTIRDTGAGYVADEIILRSFGYVQGSGVPTYFLGAAPSSTPGLLCFDNGESSRNGDPVLCQYESPDYDAGDALAWKYADTQWFSLQTKAKKSTRMPLLVYLGSKANFDDDVKWSAPIVLYVQGNRNYVTKTNVTAAGRFFRIRLRAATPGLVFRVSEIRILGRLGGTY